MNIYLEYYIDHLNRKELHIRCDSWESLPIEKIIKNAKASGRFYYISDSVWDAVGDLLLFFSMTTFHAPVNIYILHGVRFDARYYDTKCILKMYESLRKNGLTIFLKKG